MHGTQSLIAAAILLVVFAGPLGVGVASWLRMRGEPRAPLRTGWKAIVESMLWYVIAFNLVFFVQELFLVFPKSITPGLEATLYHNNHRWTGESPLAALFQGTGVLATIMAGAIAYAAGRSGRLRSPSLRLLAFWMAYCGVFMALPQFVVGALSAGSDVGMAMDYFALPLGAKAVIALVALVLMPPVAFGLTQRLLTFAHDPAQVATARARARFVFEHATLPALLAIAPTIAYRVPREWTEVVLLPVIVAFVGVGWMQAFASRVEPPASLAANSPRAVGLALGVAFGLLLVFQAVLRPGIVFP